MCKECDDPEMNSKVCSGYPGIKFRCEACGQELKQVPPEPVDPKLQSLKDTLERAQREHEAAIEDVTAAEHHSNSARIYATQCAQALEKYKRDLERRTNAALAAEFLEQEAKKLREHPEVFENLNYTQERPGVYVNQHYPEFRDNTPVITKFTMKTWPQRKVAKEGEEK